MNGRAFPAVVLEKSAISGVFRRPTGQCKHFNNKQATRARQSTSVEIRRCVCAPLPTMPADLHEIESLLAVRRDRRPPPLVRMEIAD